MTNKQLDFHHPLPKPVRLKGGIVQRTPVVKNFNIDNTSFINYILTLAKLLHDVKKNGFLTPLEFKQLGYLKDKTELEVFSLLHKYRTLTDSEEILALINKLTLISFGPGPSNFIADIAYNTSLFHEKYLAGNNLNIKTRYKAWKDIHYRGNDVIVEFNFPFNKYTLHDSVDAAIVKRHLFYKNQGLDIQMPGIIVFDPYNNRLLDLTGEKYTRTPSVFLNINIEDVLK